MEKIKYSVKDYPFADIIAVILNTTNLSKIHEENHFEKYDLFTRDKDQSTCRGQERGHVVFAFLRR